MSLSVKRRRKLCWIQTMHFPAGQHLVIFGCGYVGTALAREAQRCGAKVTALTRNAERARHLQEHGVAVIAAHLADSSWHSQITAADYLVNCVSASAPTPEGYRQSYVDGTRSILAWLQRSGGKRPNAFIYTSSTGVYPQGEGALVDEDSPTDTQHTPTAAVLAEAEAQMRLAAPELVQRTFVLRLAGIYGPGRHYLLDQLRSGATALNGKGEHRLNVIHRDDVVRAILVCLQQTPHPGGIFNVSDGHPATKAEVVRWLAEQLHVPVPPFDAAAPSIRRGGAGVPDRIILSQKLSRELHWVPQYPDYRSGYAAILRREV